ncbi:MAG: Zn-ribbon domain-containing OB-fold protein [Nanoarchaeota archaeon]|nr:Zn-ribbon domain-containing OB-fold protein [Nanoarchaeota archaeon]
MPQMSSVPIAWRLQQPRYRLIGTICTKCNTSYFPPRSLCQTCRDKGKIEKHKFPGTGKILTYTVIRIAPEGFAEFAPYAIAIIELEPGVTVAGQVVGDPEQVKTGRKVKTTFRRMYTDGKDGLLQYGMKWELLDQ